jgi:hypothetical protein
MCTNLFGPPLATRMRVCLGALFVVGSLLETIGCNTAPSVAVGAADGGTADTTSDPSATGSTSELECTEGLPSAFQKTPAPFTLPAARCGTAFDRLASTESVLYSLLDLNADRRPDLVVAADACDDDVGTKHWDVYRAGGTGFAKTPAAFTLPAARCGTAFDRLAGTGDVLYTLLDLNADRRPDLVVTADACDADVGTKHWDVYLASETGFAKTPVAFTLPAARCEVAFDRPAGAESVHYALLDTNADRRPDIVVTADACDGDVGTKHWDVYRASETGFAKTPVAFTLPAARCGTAFDRLARTEGVLFTLLDLDADRRPDLVVTSDTCDEDVGTKHWDVYHASDTGFAKAPATFSLPTARCGRRFDAVTRTEDVTYALLDLSCDERPELLVTSDTCDDEVGTKRWDVYVASDTGFEKAPKSLGLPAARCGERFDGPGKIGRLTYSILDMSADGRGDLIVIADTCDDEIGSARWEKYTLE